MSSASSNQSVVRDGMDYEEVYPSGHKDQESPGEDRSLFASSLSSTNEDVEMVDVTTQRKALVISALYLKRTSHN